MDRGQERIGLVARRRCPRRLDQRDRQGQGQGKGQGQGATRACRSHDSSTGSVFFFFIRERSPRLETRRRADTARRIFSFVGGHDDSLPRKRRPAASATTVTTAAADRGRDPGAHVRITAPRSAPTPAPARAVLDAQVGPRIGTRRSRAHHGRDGHARDAGTLDESRGKGETGHLEQAGPRECALSFLLLLLRAAQ